MNETILKNRERADRYSKGLVSRLLEQAEAIHQERQRADKNDEPTLHRLADRLREVRGGVQVAAELIPQVIGEHRKGVVWAMERLLVAARHLDTDPCLESAERQQLDERVAQVIRLIEEGNLDQAESQVRELETRTDQLRRASLEQEFDRLLASIQTCYPETVQ